MNQDGPSLIIEAFCVKSILKCFWGLEPYIYKMFKSSVDPCILI